MASNGQLSMFELGSFEFELHPKAFLDLYSYRNPQRGLSSVDNDSQSIFDDELWSRETIYAPLGHISHQHASALSRHVSILGGSRTGPQNQREDSISQIDRQAAQTQELRSEQDSPPDGGVRAWLQVVASFLLVFNGFGYINAFGVFQAAYAENMGQSLSSISFVGSFQIFLLFFVGTLSGRALDAGFFHSLLRSGCAMQVGGIFATASATKYWQLFLAQGILQGIGNGMLFTPLVWLVSIYFTKRRGLALGLASCGAPVGGIVFPLAS